MDNRSKKEIEEAAVEEAKSLAELRAEAIKNGTGSQALFDAEDAIAAFVLANPAAAKAVAIKNAEDAAAARLAALQAAVST